MKRLIREERLRAGLPPGNRLRNPFPLLGTSPLDTTVEIVKPTIMIAER